MTKEEILKLLHIAAPYWERNKFPIGIYIIELVAIDFDKTKPHDILASASRIELRISLNGNYVFPRSDPAFASQPWSKRFKKFGLWVYMSLSEVVEVFQHCYRLNQLSAFI